LAAVNGEADAKGLQDTTGLLTEKARMEDREERERMHLEALPATPASILRGRV